MKRREAMVLGLKIYQPDQPCGYGHMSGRYTSTGTCVECRKEPVKRSSYIIKVQYEIPPKYKDDMDAMYQAIMIQSKIDMQMSIAETQRRVINNV